jgi:glucosamine-6-phosphate deaminase
MGCLAAEAAAKVINKSIAENGAANIVLATGASQFTFHTNFVTQDVDWAKVTAFHLDEYIGMPETHPASFRKYLKERFVDHVPPLNDFHYVDGEAPDPAAECRRLDALIADHPIDVSCIGIGENGHIAFNDPPADFNTDAAYLVVSLDEACRRQQLGEGWFSVLDDVPTRAISMSIRCMMKSRTLIVTIPDERKAEAVKNCFEGPVTNQVPGSILQQHDDCQIFLDKAAASLLTTT